MNQLNPTRRAAIAIVFVAMAIAAIVFIALTITSNNALSPDSIATRLAPTPESIATDQSPTPDPIATQQAQEPDLENTLYIDLKDGRVVIQMHPDLAPNHVARIKELAREGFYDGVVFHRVIDGFMAQTGDPTGTGSGGSGKKLDAEFNDGKHTRGAVSMARTNDPNSADSQFFIVFDDSSYLDGQYTVWGTVTEGMEHVDAIKRGPPNGTVSDPDAMIKVQVAADAQ